MRKMNATYHAPEGDSRVVDWNGVTFYDGLPAELNSDDHEVAMNKIPKNQFFTYEMVEDDGAPPKRKLGRPSNAEIAAKAEQAEESA